MPFYSSPVRVGVPDDVPFVERKKRQYTVPETARLGLHSQQKAICESAGLMPLLHWCQWRIKVLALSASYDHVQSPRVGWSLSSEKVTAENSALLTPAGWILMRPCGTTPGSIATSLDTCVSQSALAERLVRPLSYGHAVHRAQPFLSKPVIACRKQKFRRFGAKDANLEALSNVLAKTECYQDRTTRGRDRNLALNLQQQ